MHKKRIYIFILVSLCFLVYFNSLTGAFISDDLSEIPLNQKLARPSAYWAYPTNLLNSLAYLFFGYNPVAYHLANVILHSLNTVLVFFFLCLFFKPGSSFLAACLFAVHPVHAEAVSWISGRTYLVLTFFILTVYLLYYRAAYQRSAGGLRKRDYFLALSVFAYFLINNFTFFSLLPFLLILSDVTFGKARKNYKLWLPFLGLVIFRFILARFEISSRIAYMAGISGAGPVRGNLFIDAVISLMSHLGLLLWPAKLTLYHGPAALSDFLLYAGMILLVLLFLSLPILLKKAKAIFFAFGIFLLFLSPTFSPVMITGLVQERYLYFASIALCMCAAYLYEKYLGRPNETKKIIAWSAFAFILFAYSARTIIRNQEWQTPEKFWLATLKTSYNNPAAHYGMGLFYYQSGNPEKAIGYFEKAIEISPHYVDAINSLGQAYQDIGKSEAALASFKKAIQANPFDSDAYYNLGTLYSEIGNTDQAIEYFKQAIKVNPEDLSALSNLGVVYAGLGRREEAIASFKQALKVGPDYGAGHFNLAVTYFTDKKYSLAVRHCDRAVKLGHKVPVEFLNQLKPYRNHSKH